MYEKRETTTLFVGDVKQDSGDATDKRNWQWPM